MKKFLISSILIVLLLTIFSIFEKAYAGDDCVSYSTTVISETLANNMSINISSSYAKIRISRIEISIASSTVATNLVLYENNKGFSVGVSTGNATVLKDIDLSTSSSTAVTLILDYDESNLLIAHYGLRARFFNSSGAIVKINILYR